MRLVHKNRMGMVSLVGLVFTILAGQTLGASNLTYTLQLGGDNHAAEWKAGTKLMYTPGDPTDNQSFQPGVITWDVKIEASGTQDSGNGAGYEIEGVANFVFYLSLHEGSADGPRVSGATFFSTMNDGTGGFPLAPAAFAASFNQYGLGPGRVIDIANKGGPNMSVYTYPTYDVVNAELQGMGAGYSQWNKSGSTTYTTEGVGKADGLGVLPLCEGQIDMSGFSTGGTYVLKLVVVSGNNVLRGDIDLNQNQDAFATAAETLVGDTITFQLGEPPKIHLVGAESIKYHNGMPMNLPLPVDVVGSEPRMPMGMTWYVLDFDADVKATDGSIDLGQEVVVNPPFPGGVLQSAPDKIDLQGADYPDQTCVTITLSGLEGVGGEVFEGDNDVHIIVMQADCDPSGVVNIFDLQAIKDNLFQTVTNSNCYADVNLDMSINIFDLEAVKTKLFGGTVTCP